MATSMAELMTQMDKKTLKVQRGDSVTGKVILISDTEVVVDLGGKNEGVIDKRELPQDVVETLKVGDDLTSFVTSSENDTGRIALSLTRQTGSTRRSKDPKKWLRFTQTLTSHSKLRGQVIEINKGGFLVEVQGTRAFLPGSQLSLEVLKQKPEIVGEEIDTYTIEVDEGDNRLVLSMHNPAAKADSAKLSALKPGDRVKGKVVAVYPFGVYIDVDGVEGMVRGSDVAWEKETDPTKLYQVEQEVEAQVLNLDEQLGRVNLSLKTLKSDPFEELAKNYQVDDVVTGEVLEISPQGIRIQLKGGVEGFIPSASVQPGNNYSVGQSTNFLVAEIDNRRRQVVLAPFITSTSGLIYR
jgi:small subunit ribosomal protein S1